MPKTMQLGMPRRVLALAVTMGAHGDCLIADAEGCCSVCRDLVNTAFDVTYAPGGMRSLGEVLDELFEDMWGDQHHG